MFWTNHQPPHLTLWQNGSSFILFCAKPWEGHCSDLLQGTELKSPLCIIWGRNWYINFQTILMRSVPSLSPKTDEWINARKDTYAHKYTVNLPGHIDRAGVLSNTTFDRRMHTCCGLFTYRWASCWLIEAIWVDHQTRGKANSDAPVKLGHSNGPYFFAWEHKLLHSLFWEWSKTSRWCIFSIHERNIYQGDRLQARLRRN